VSDEPDDDTWVRYVLGTLPEEEQAALEERYFRDDDAFERVLAVEDDLLHEYAQGGLGEDERQRLEARLLRSPEGRERLARARALLAALQEPARPRRPVPWRAAAAAAAIAAPIVGWLVLDRSGPRVESTSAGPSPTPPTNGPATPSPAISPRPLAQVVALALAPGLVRGEGALPRVTLPPSATALRLTAALPAGVRSAPYRAALTTAEGRPAWSGTAQPGGAGAVVIEIPAASLPEGDYELVLGAPASGEEVASYTFGVRRE
jgi:hypothetical protein